MFKTQNLRSKYLKNNYILVLIYALLVLIGGVMGFVLSGSNASLYASAPSFLALVAAAYGIYKGKAAGHIASLVIIILLDGFFSFRYMHTGKAFPGGLMAFISLVTLLLLVLRIRKGAK